MQWHGYCEEENVACNDKESQWASAVNCKPQKVAGKNTLGNNGNFISMVFYFISPQMLSLNKNPSKKPLHLTYVQSYFWNYMLSLIWFQWSGIHTKITAIWIDMQWQTFGAFHRNLWKVNFPLNTALHSSDNLKSFPRGGLKKSFRIDDQAVLQNLTCLLRCLSEQCNRGSVVWPEHCLSIQSSFGTAPYRESIWHRGSRGKSTKSQLDCTGLEKFIHLICSLQRELEFLGVILRRVPASCAPLCFQSSSPINS